jgi:Tol biopolymer transport system component
MIAEKFAPGILSTIFHEHSSPTYSPDGKEIFYTLAHEGGHRLMYLRMENGQWSIPRTAPFSGESSDDGPKYSPDVKRLYFGSRRHIVGFSE